MLSRELMASALLGLSWLTALMIALDALIDVRTWRSRLAKWQGLVRGEVKTDELASHEVEQRIKQLDGDAPGLVFFDRQHVSLLKGGAVQLESGLVEVVGAPGAEVWTDEASRRQSAACHSTTQFDAMLTAAQGAGGGLRAVRTFLRVGQPVWLEGTRDGERFTSTMVSNFDPRPFARARITATFGLIAVNFAWVAAGTVLALWPPAFGLVSIGGAAVLIGHFLGMTPLAIVTREKSRSPAVAFIRGTWRRDAVKDAGGVTAPA
jgi:hypothetical protein